MGNSETGPGTETGGATGGERAGGGPGGAPAEDPGASRRGEGQPRVALVTGAESGIGRATAVELARRGMDVGITWFTDGEAAADAATEVRALGRHAETCYLDQGRLPDAADVVDELADRLGRLDVLVNNAGMGMAEAFLDVDFATVRRMLDVDLAGPFLLAQRAARRMVAQGSGGRIVNVTSVHEHQPRVGTSAYSAAKGGLGLLTQVMALELAEHGILVNAVAPGEIATRMNGHEDDAEVDVHAELRPGIPLGRPGTAHEVASVIGFLADPGSGGLGGTSYVTGASWAVDGGMLRMGPMAGSHMSDHEWRQP